MKVDVIGMILSNAGMACFDGILIDDSGKPMPAVDSLHTLMMEYAKVMDGGTSDLVVASREVLSSALAAAEPVAWRRRTKHGWDYRTNPPTERMSNQGWIPLRP
ncbi:hypothetical protein [Uliginosibacterium sediminicola]|uniref:Uncharacterized protein n=1 Tax=Uliginosibacterium sediminicola TaxID=2024550 RepID=A0ABU9YVZ0_9RHOO